jgi:hypothetical protein
MTKFPNLCTGATNQSVVDIQITLSSKTSTRVLMYREGEYGYILIKVNDKAYGVCHGEIVLQECVQGFLLEVNCGVSSFTDQRTIGSPHIMPMY